MSAVKAKAKSIHCVSNQKQVGLATKLYMDDNNGMILPLWIASGAAGFVPNNPAAFSIQSPFYWWADKLRVDGYGAEKGVMDCPVLVDSATKASGGLYSSIRTLGIGMNFPEYGWTPILPASRSILTAKRRKIRWRSPASRWCMPMPPRFPIPLKPTRIIGKKSRPPAVFFFSRAERSK